MIFIPKYKFFLPVVLIFHALATSYAQQTSDEIEYMIRARCSQIAKDLENAKNYRAYLENQNKDLKLQILTLNTELNFYKGLPAYPTLPNFRQTPPQQPPGYYYPPAPCPSIGELEAARDRIANLEIARNMLQNTINSLNRENDRLRDENIALQARISVLQDQILLLRKQLFERDVKIDSLNRIIFGLEGEIKDLNRKLQQLKSDYFQVINTFNKSSSTLYADYEMPGNNSNEKCYIPLGKIIAPGRKDLKAKKINHLVANVSLFLKETVNEYNIKLIIKKKNSFNNLTESIDIKMSRSFEVNTSQEGYSLYTGTSESKDLSPPKKGLVKSLFSLFSKKDEKFLESGKSYTYEIELDKSLDTIPVLPKGEFTLD